MKFKKILILLLFVSLLMVSTMLVYGNSISWTGTWTTGGMGGSWYSQAISFTEIIQREEPGIVIRCIPGGGIANIPLVDSGDAELGFTITPFSYIATKGEDPFKTSYLNIRSIAGSFMDSPYNFLAGKEKGIKTVEEFIQLIKDGKPVRLVTSPVGTTVEFILGKILEYYDVTYDDITKNGGKVTFIDQDEQISLMTDRHADFWAISQAAPSAEIMQVLVNRELQFLELSDDILQYLAQTYNFAMGKIPAKAYPGTLEEDLDNLIAGSSIIVNKSVPEEVVYAITKILNENAEELYKVSSFAECFDPKTAGQKGMVGVPLHPGAERYYKEQGYSYYNE